METFVNTFFFFGLKEQSGNFQDCLKGKLSSVQMKAYSCGSQKFFFSLN